MKLYAKTESGLVPYDTVTQDDVETAPTAGSINPVSSGGVFKAMAERAQVLFSDDAAVDARALLLAKISHVTGKPDGVYLIYGGWKGISYGVTIIEKTNNGNAYVVLFFGGFSAYQAYIYNNSGTLTIGAATQFTVSSI